MNEIDQIILSVQQYGSLDFAAAQFQKLQQDQFQRLPVELQQHIFYQQQNPQIYTDMQTQYNTATETNQTIGSPSLYSNNAQSVITTSSDYYSENQNSNTRLGQTTSTNSYAQPQSYYGVGDARDSAFSTAHSYSSTSASSSQTPLPQEHLSTEQIHHNDVAKTNTFHYASEEKLAQGIEQKMASISLQTQNGPAN